MAVQIFADEVFEHRKLDGTVSLGDANRATEITHRLGRISPPPDAAKRGHARIVPPAYPPFLHQLQQLAFTQQRVGEVEAVKFNLPRRKNPQLFDEPVVKRAMILKLPGQRGGGALS